MWDRARAAVGSAMDQGEFIIPLSDGQEMVKLEGHSDDVMSVVAAHKSNTVVTTSRDNSVRVWSLGEYRRT